MKICWFDNNRLGLVQDGVVRDVSDALKILPAPHYPAVGKGDFLIANLPQIRGEIEKIAGAAARSLERRSIISSMWKKRTPSVKFSRRVIAGASKSRVCFSRRRARWSGAAKESGPALLIAARIMNWNWGW
jgi:hypothetical protein